MNKAYKAVLLLILTLLLSSCQPTPEDAVVIGKNGDFGQKIMQTAEPEPSGEPEDGQQKWQETLDFQSGVQVVIDANIELPQVKAYPVYEVKPHEITLEEAKKLADFFLQGQPVYSNKLVKTKTEIEQEILATQSNIEKVKAEDASPERQAEIEGWTNFLNRLKDEYAKAPEKEPKPEPTSVYLGKYNGDVGYNKYMSIKAHLNDESWAAFAIAIWDNNESLIAFSRNTELYYEWNIDAADTLAGLNITKQEAEAKAEEALKLLGITDFQLMSTEAKATILTTDNEETLSNAAADPDRKKCFLFHFCQVYNGIPITNLQPCYGMETENKANDEYDRPWATEDIMIGIDDGGVLKFQWDSPGDVVRTINENVKLSDFEEIKELFKKQIFYQRTWSYPEMSNNEITIKKVKLGLMRVKMKDENTYVMLPVWDFIGDWTHTALKEVTTKNVSFLTLNAVDGSIIDRSRGY